MNTASNRRNPVAYLSLPLALAAGITMASRPAQASPAEPAEPATISESAPTGLPDSTWSALEGQELELSMNDGSTVHGKLLGSEGATVTLAAADGEILAIEKTAVAGAKTIASAPAPAPTPEPTPAPAVVGPTPTPAPVPATPQYSGNPGGWAVGGAATGFTLGAAALGLAIGADVTTDEGQVPAIPLGATATVLMGAATPIAIAAGGSARKRTGVRGSVGLRITAWITYGLALSDAIALIALGVADIEPPPGVPSSVGALGFISAGLASTDALISNAQAKRSVSTAPASASAAKKRGLSVHAGPTRDRRGAVVGLSGRF